MPLEGGYWNGEVQRVVNKRGMGSTVHLDSEQGTGKGGYQFESGVFIISSTNRCVLDPQDKG